MRGVKIRSHWNVSKEVHSSSYFGPGTNMEILSGDLLDLLAALAPEIKRISHFPYIHMHTIFSPTHPQLGRSYLFHYTDYHSIS